MVLHKHGDLLYNGIREVIKENLKRISKEVSSAVNEKLLKVIVQKWDGHKLHMTMIRDISMYMV